LDVNQALRRMDRPYVGLEDPEVASGSKRVETLGEGAHELRFDVAGRGRDRRWGQALTRDGGPAGGEVARDVPDQGPANPEGEIVPPQTPRVWVEIDVVPIAVAISEIQAADDRKL